MLSVEFNILQAQKTNNNKPTKLDASSEAVKQAKQGLNNSHVTITTHAKLLFKIDDNSTDSCRYALLGYLQNQRNITIQNRFSNSTTTQHIHVGTPV